MSDDIAKARDSEPTVPAPTAGSNRIMEQPSKKRGERDEAILKRARKRFSRCLSAEGDNRKKMLQCLKFINGDQWEDKDSKAREGRPTLTINKLKTFVNQITNNQRENRPSINISPVGDKSDKEVAKMLKGLIRAIERDSNADIAYDTAFWYAVACGVGWWRITTDYAAENTFDQVVEVRRIRNPFTVYCDPLSIEPDGADAKYMFVTEMMDRSDFKEQFPKADPMNFEGENTLDSYREWIEHKKVRIAEYFEIKNEKKRLIATSTGFVGYFDDLSNEVKAKIESGDITIDSERDVQVPKVMWYKLTAKDVLEKKEWAGKWIPLVRVIGNEIDIEGKLSITGAINDAIDPQRMYNYWSSLETEMITLAPKAPWVMAEGQQEGHEEEWTYANVENRAYLTYKPTDINGHPVPPPQRQPFAGVPSGIVEARNATAQDMQATTGIRFDATLHERTNDESGRALREIRRATDIGTYHFIDNLTRSLKHTGRILVDLIPKIYDTRRVITILRDDDSEKAVQLDPNQPQTKAEKPHPLRKGEKIDVFNPTYGEYGVTVTTGPSYATQRIEAAQSMMDFVRAVPQAAQIASDLIAKNMDWPGSDEMAKRLAMTIPPHMLQTDMKGVPPEIQGVIGSQQHQLQQLQQQLMMALKELNDKKVDQSQAQDKIDKDFEAKILAILQKNEAAMHKEVGARIEQQTQQTANLAGQLQQFMQMFTQKMGVQENVGQ